MKAKRKTNMCQGIEFQCDRKGQNEKLFAEVLQRQKTHLKMNETKRTSEIHIMITFALSMRDEHNDCKKKNCTCHTEWENFIILDTKRIENKFKME